MHTRSLLTRGQNEYQIRRGPSHGNHPHTTDLHYRDRPPRRACLPPSRGQMSMQRSTTATRTERKQMTTQTGHHRFRALFDESCCLNKAQTIAITRTTAPATPSPISNVALGGRPDRFGGSCQGIAAADDSCRAGSSCCPGAQSQRSPTTPRRRPHVRGDSRLRPGGVDHRERSCSVSYPCGSGGAGEYANVDWRAKWPWRHGTECDSPS